MLPRPFTSRLCASTLGQLPRPSLQPFTLPDEDTNIYYDMVKDTGDMPRENVTGTRGPELLEL